MSGAEKKDIVSEVDILVLFLIPTPNIFFLNFKTVCLLLSSNDFYCQDWVLSLLEKGRIFKMILSYC